MKCLALVAAVFCGLSIACSRHDTNEAGKWPRSVEPRLTGSTWRPCGAVKAGQCSGAVVAATKQCDEIITSAAEASHILASQPNCTDGAVEALQKFARTDAAAMNDLAAAYIVRAQRQNEPADFLRALDTAEHAVAAAPQSQAAHFNRALAQEALGFSYEAAQEWDEIAKADASEWGAEARQHRDRLRRATAVTPWDRVLQQIPAALRANDANKLARLIDPFPLSAEAYFMRLPPTNRAMFAEVLERRLGDRFAIDIANGSPVPMSLIARYRLAARYASDANAVAKTLPELASLERDVIAHGYKHFLAPIHVLRANALVFLSRYPEAVSEFESAIAIYEALRSNEDVTNARVRLIGALLAAGQDDLAWRQVMRALPHIHSLTQPADRHSLLGETAKTALALGYPKIALAYQNAAVRLFRSQLTTVAPEQLAAIRAVQYNEAVALRERADIELHLEHYDNALQDLDEAVRLNQQIVIAKGARQTVRARIEEIRGQAFLRTDPNRAVDAFTNALALASDDYLTFRASLLAQRAGALRRAGRDGDAEEGLRQSLEVLRIEESQNLERRKRGFGEDLWSAYFSRFQETYRQLIGQLLDEGKPLDAFVYAERARASEPLNLVQPQSAERDIDLKQLQAALPPGTFLLEYALLDDRTITWIISHDRFDVLTQDVRRKDVERRRLLLQGAARARNSSDFETQLDGFYDTLIDGPLQAIKTTPARLVVIPDGPMHGLPIAAARNSRTGRFLIQIAPVETAPSARLYLVSLMRDRAMPRTPNPRVLLIGDPAFDKSLTLTQDLQPLPGAQREVDALQDLYGSLAIARTKREATVTEFLELARDSAVVDIAAHGIVNAQSPAHSTLVLAPSSNDRGMIDAQELLTRLKLDKTRLVILSVCSSAGGLPVGPEGVAPLVRSVIAAGAPAVIGSLWNVQDATTEELLVSFHRHYRLGSDAAVALQLAQIELLEKQRSVLAWAPFAVIGHASSPFTAPQHTDKEKPP